MEAQSRTSIDRASLARIATLAVTHVDGLEPAAEPAATADVAVADDGALRVSLAVRGRWGTELPTAAERVRAEVVRVVAAMTGLHVGCVDVEVTGLLEPGAPDGAPTEPPARTRAAATGAGGGR